MTFSNNFVLGVVDEVLGACAEEVTAKMEETKSGGDKILESIKANNPDMLKTIQLGIRRSNTSSEFPANVRELYKAVQQAVMADWTQWEGACSGALVEALKERKTEAEAELGERDNARGLNGVVLATAVMEWVSRARRIVNLHSFPPPQQLLRSTRRRSRTPSPR